MINLKRILLLIVIFALSSCYARQGFPVDSKGVGTSKVFEGISYDRAWGASIKAVNSGYFKNKELKFVSGDKKKGLIKLERRASTMELMVTGIDRGERVVVFVDKVGGRRAVRIEAVSQKIVTDAPLSKDWEPMIIRKIEFLIKGAR